MAERLNYKRYFLNKNSIMSYDKYEREIKENIESNLNGRLIIGDKYQFLQDWRGPIDNPDNYHRNLDKKIFGIPIDCEIYPDQLNDMNEDREHYSEYDSEKIKKEEILKNLKKSERDYRCKDRHGNIKYNKDGTEKMKGKVGRAMVNFKSNMQGSNASEVVEFIAENAYTILVILICTIISLIILFATIYFGGMLTSIGHTPFVICGDEQISGDKVVNLPPTEEVEEMATPEYAAQALITVAKQNRWTENAIIGTLAYTMQEGIGMGTFTYETNHRVKGPSGVLKDKTLNNQAWLDWLHSPATLKRYNEVYYGANTSRYAAIGLGLWQMTDTHNTKDGPLGSSGATKMVEAAIAARKPWQDPSFQLDYLFNTIFPSKVKDSDYIDPKSFNGSAEEYCRRVTAFVGMPGYKYTNNSDYMRHHVRRVPEAKKIYSQYTGVEIGSLGEQTRNLCQGADSVTTGGNATIADAAVSLASGAGKEAKIRYTNGPDNDNLTAKEIHDERLKLYKEKHLEILDQGKLYFASCDRGAATAIRWSGADLDFPDGYTTTQWNYLNKSDKWKLVGDYGSCELQPGDVLITKGRGHIKIYVGKEAVQKRFPGKDCDMYAASFEQYYPYVYKDSPSYDRRSYAVFRNIKSDKENNISNNANKLSSNNDK